MILPFGTVFKENYIEKEKFKEAFRRFQNCIPQATTRLQAQTYTKGLKIFKEELEI